MTLLPRSLFGRLLATATVAMLAALGFATFAIGHVLERFVLHGLDDRLDAQIALVARGIGADGRLSGARLVDMPPFDRPGSGWAWEVIAPSDTLRSGSLGKSDIVPTSARPGPVGPPPAASRPLPFEGLDPDGLRVHGRVLSVATARGDVVILATGPRAVVEQPLREATTPLLLSLLALGFAMALAILVQLRIGLRPIRAVREALADVREGRREHIEATEPSELVPLVDELNALIDANRGSLAQARGHVANLAHGLKTPLAGLRLDLEGRDPDGRLTRHVDRIDAHVRHHLGRARAASGADIGRIATQIASHVDDLVAALKRIHAERPVRIGVTIDRGLMVHCDPQDLDEMLGNLLDNAWLWARSAIRVTAEERGRDVFVRIADDGPGLARDLIERSTVPGWRLDSSKPGHGFGLTIVRELAELHGGRLLFSDNDGGGLAVDLVLRRSIS